MHFKNIWSYLVCRPLDLIKKNIFKGFTAYQSFVLRAKAKDGKKMNAFHAAGSAADSKALNLQS